MQLNACNDTGMDGKTERNESRVSDTTGNNECTLTDTVDRNAYPMDGSLQNEQSIHAHTVLKNEQVIHAHPVLPEYQNSPTYKRLLKPNGYSSYPALDANYHGKQQQPQQQESCQLDTSPNASTAKRSRQSDQMCAADLDLPFGMLQSADCMLLSESSSANDASCRMDTKDASNSQVNPLRDCSVDLITGTNAQSGQSWFGLKMTAQDIDNIHRNLVEFEEKQGTLVIPSTNESINPTGIDLIESLASDSSSTVTTAVPSLMPSMRQSPLHSKSKGLAMIGGKYSKRNQHLQQQASSSSSSTTPASSSPKLNFHRPGRPRIRIEFIQNKTKRQTTFSKHRKCCSTVLANIGSVVVQF